MATARFEAGWLVWVFAFGFSFGCGYGYVQVGEDESDVAARQLVCNDSPPTAQYTCEQQNGWGKCNEPWMKGHCESVCGGCGSSATCSDSTPLAGTTCEQQKSWGKCNEPWMKGHCESVCGVCGVKTCNDSTPLEGTTCEQQKSWGKCNEPWMKGHCESVCGGCGIAPAPVSPTSAPTAGTFHVRGRHLYDRCGEKVVLRGVNEMIIWNGGDTDALALYQEIAKSGANSVRIVWNSSGTADKLDRTIQNALSNQLIPMVENHDATGDFSKVRAVVDYWTRPDVVAVLKKYKETLLLNIANEAGANVSDDEYKSVYKQAISRIRNTGVTVPLVIDASIWGQNTAQLFRVGAELSQSDPLRNIIFSVHLYDAAGVSTDKITRLADQISAWAYPMVIGEFASATSGSCHLPTDYRTIMAVSQQKEISWYPWSWGGVANQDCGSQFNMGSGRYDSLRGWGLEVAVTDRNSIKNTSRRPQSMVLGRCL
jgi:mannan endo-1,4-beta-mannosidase